MAAVCETLLMLSFTACSSIGLGQKTAPPPEPGGDFKVSVTVPDPAKASPPPPTQPQAPQPPVSIGPKPPDVPSIAGAQPPTGTVAPVPGAEGKPPAPPDPSATLGGRSSRLTVVPPSPAQPPAPGAPGAAGAPPASGDAGNGGPVDRGPAVRIRQGQAQTSERPGGAPSAQAPGRLVVFNFDNADIEIVLQATSELLVFNYVLAPEARGKKVTVQTTGRIPVDDIFPVLLTILDVNGLAAIKSGSVYRIIAKQGAPQTSTRTVVGAQLEPQIPGDEVLTQIIPLKFVNAVEVAGLLRPFVPQQGAISAHRDTNLLVVTDVAANIRRLLDIVKLLDVDVTTSELQIIALKFADAQEVAQILTQLFASGRLRTAGPQLPAGITPPAAPAAPGGAPGAAPRPAAPSGSGSDSAQDRPPLIVPERRSNSLIIYARKGEMDTISRLIEKLDADIYGGQRIFFYFCENTKSRDLAATLDAIFGRGSGASASSTSTPPGQPPRPGGSTGLPTQSQIQPTRGTTAGAGGARGGVGGLLEEFGAGIGAETRFIPDEATNSIIVTTYPRVWGEIEGLLKKLDRSPRQVLIEVLVAEVTLDDSTSLGISWAVQHGRYGATFTGINPPSGGGGANLPGRLPSVLPSLIAGGGLVPTGLSFATFATNEFLLAINALAAANKVNVLSSPSVMTTENKKAVINVSQSVPVVTSQQVPIGGTVTTGVAQTTSVVGTQTVEYRDVGIVLTVTPRIGEQGTVSLEVKQEVNDILTESFGTTGSPAFTKREAETSVVLLNNQTLVLGGLIQNRRTLDKVGIPYLNKIPILGYAFGNTTEVVRKVELVLLITPRVIGTALDASRVTDQMRRITPEIRDSIRDKQFPYPSFEFMRP